MAKKSTPTAASTATPLSADLLEILRDPQAIQEGARHGDDPGRLELVNDYWLVSADTGYKYPIRDGIPVMLVEEGARWKDTPVEALPVPPPPAVEAAPESRAGEVALDAAPAGPNYALFAAIAIGAVIVLILALIGLNRRHAATVIELPAEPIVP
ncbi:Trm112 family protein [Promineifilum sp.]|uniref:Trm112 family protein n=1 Tax=Promineifilum sp. TaxID=2664178 RepID=UPI0035B3D1D0